MLEYQDVPVLWLTAVFTIVLGTLASGTFARDCYNYKEEPRVRQCDNGCCGDKYEEYCCNVTLQIVGSIIGALIVLSAVIAIIYCCYKKKSKRTDGEESMAGGLLRRMGLRSNSTNIRQLPRQPQRRRPMQPMGYQHSCPVTHMNPAYVHQLPGQPPGTLYPPVTQGDPHLPLAPTAPMPPPYSMDPPPYGGKGPPPPPSYNVAVMGNENKYAGYNERMPPPS